METGSKAEQEPQQRAAAGAVNSVPWLERLEEHPSWPVLAQVPGTIAAAILLPRFTLRDLLTMEKGHVIESDCLTSDLIPLKIGAVQIAWGEFEQVERALALRVSKLA